MANVVDDQRMPPWVRRAILWWWAILVALWILYVTAIQLRSLLIQLVVALFLSFAFEPVVDRLSARGIGRGTATAISMFVVFAFIGVFVYAMGSLVADQLRRLAEDLPDYVRSAQQWLEERFGIVIESDALIDELQLDGTAGAYLSTAADNLVGVSTSLLSILFQLITIAMFAFYFTADGPRLRRFICSMLPPSQQEQVLDVWELAINKTGAYIASRVILAIISAVAHWTVFALLDLPSSVALALWVGIVSQFIPVIGVYIAGIVPALIALGIDPVSALWVVVFLTVYQQIENYLIQPRVTAQTLDMHPAVAFFAVLAGTATFGATGALLALPVVATVAGFSSAYVARHDVIDSRLVSSLRTTGAGGTAGGPTSPSGPADAVRGSAGEAVDETGG